MIHQFFVIDRFKSIGSGLYTAETSKLQIKTELLIGLVQALMMLGEEMGPTKGGLREAELGEYQIGIMAKNHIAYVVIQDSFDSEPFTSKLLENVIDKYHQTFLDANFTKGLRNKDKIKEDIRNMLQTMKFPIDKLPQVREVYEYFEHMTNSISDTIFLADLDDGIIEMVTPTTDKTIIRLLMEILSEIPFERHWIGESKLMRPKVIRGKKKSHEAWLIYRIGVTDFCVMGRAFYNQGEERDNLIYALEQLTGRIENILNN